MELPAPWQERLGALRELDLDGAAVGSWPIAVRAALLAFALGVVLAAAWVFVLSGRVDALRTAQSEESSLLADYRRRWTSSMDVAEARDAHDAAEARFGAMQEQLPRRTEVPALVEDISGAALAHGLTIGKLALGEERVNQHHVELPIELSVEGGYHDIGAFLDALAHLPRILAPGDFTLQGSGGDLQLDIRLHTWRQGGDSESQQ